MEWNGAEQNRMEWNEMERNGINISLYCLDILKRRGTKLMVSGDIILY
jgi:hypothetical protein